MRTWKLRIANKLFAHIECRIVAKEVDIAMRRVAKELANAKSTLGDQEWYLSALEEV